MKILIVEDNLTNRAVLRDVLRFFSYVVVEAENGAKGVELAKAEVPALIFMDLQMPVMDGYVATAALRADPKTKDIKIVALTSSAMKGDKDKVMASGFDGYVIKPFDIHQVVELVKKLAG